MNPAPLIFAKNLKKVYGDAVAVDGTDFSILRGECYGFLGPNGAGKTTTIKMVTCFSPRTSGVLTVAEKDVQQKPREIKGGMGVVPQDENLDPDLNVLDNLLVYARYFGISKKKACERAADLLEFFSLTDRKKATVRELSGGMRQRLLIARALLNKPEILVLDEPTTGLDPQARHHIWQRLRLLKKNGITMILTTHYMEEASQLCDRVAIMDKGKILKEGNPAELVKEHIGAEVIEVRLDEKEQEGFLNQLKEFEFSSEKAGDTLFLFLTTGSRDLLKFLVAANNSLFIHRPAGLEDLFLRLTGRGLKE